MNHAPDDRDDWRQTHLGRLLGHAMRRFDARVLQLMARNVQTPLALSNLAARAGMSKQAMADLVTQCHAWGLVTREADARDARARIVRYTPTGLAWRAAFRDALAQAEAEFRAEVGADVATVVLLGLEAYAGGEGRPA
jgi:DNA-binding MarR family transcriptional regulator